MRRLSRSTHSWCALWPAILATIASVAGLAWTPCAQATEQPAKSPRLIDPEDGWVDASEFLDTAHGFVPLVAPITEPAVGYGLVGALVFIDRKPLDAAQRFTRPNIAAVGGLATENGTRGLFGAHLGTWLDGRLRSIAAVADMDVNLEYFGLGDSRNPGSGGLAYTVAARGGVVGGNYRLGDTPYWVGLRYALAQTNVGLHGSTAGLPGLSESDLDLRLGAVTPSFTLDARDNFFTPTRGWYADLSIPVFRDAFGSDRDFETATLTGMYYRPLGRSLFLSARGTAKTSSDGTPFYLRPFVSLRGVQALSYQGEQAAETEIEMRWQLHPRFSLIAFAGAGVARGDGGQSDRQETVTAGGAGFRYLMARKHGLHMGVDVAAGPDEPILYVIFGSAWMRP